MKKLFKAAAKFIKHIGDYPKYMATTREGIFSTLIYIGVILFLIFPFKEIKVHSPEAWIPSIIGASVFVTFLVAQNISEFINEFKD
jgi:hypothetical protein